MKFYESPNKVWFAKTGPQSKSIDGRRGLEYKNSGLSYGTRNPITAPVNDPLQNPYIRKEIGTSQAAGVGGVQTSIFY